MNHFIYRLCGAYVLCCAAISTPQAQTTTAAAALLSTQLPAFIENKGQITGYDQSEQPQVTFSYQREGVSAFLLRDGIAYQFSQQESEQQRAVYRMDLRLDGANPAARISTQGKSADYAFYPPRYDRPVHHFSTLTYHNVYEGIDWVVYSRKEGLKYDFVLAPHADPRRIRLRFDYAEKIAIEEDGTLLVTNRLGSIREAAPIGIQAEKTIPIRFVLEGQTVSFEIMGDYDPQQPLTIDPTVLWATFYGGFNSDKGNTCAVDAQGNVYLSGSTGSATQIASGGYQMTHGNNGDAFLVKFNRAGVRQWATYYGGIAADIGESCAVDASGNVYMVGRTTSNNNIAFTSINGGEDAFIVKFNSSGQWRWSKYYGGTGTDRAYSCAVDAAGDVYMAGTTTSSSNIASGGYQNTMKGGSDAFLVKFSTTGTRLWATYYGGSETWALTPSTDDAYFCTVDAAGNVYLAGATTSNSDIASSGAHQTDLNNDGNVYNPENDAFVAKFNSAGVRQWATYYGGIATDYAEGCAVDAAGNVYLSGVTRSASPTNAIAFNGFDMTANPPSTNSADNSFLVKFNSAGVRQWGTYYAAGITADVECVVEQTTGDVYWTASTYAAGYATAGTYQSTFNATAGLHVGLIAKFDGAGNRLWASYTSTGFRESINGSALGADGRLYLAGTTAYNFTPTTGGHQTTNHGGGGDALLIVFGDPCSTTYETLTVSACDSYTLNGQPYTNSGTYTQTLVNAGGCDSILTLNLTINTSTNDTTTAIICGASYLWAADGQTYTNSGIYYHYGTNVNGCPHTDVLILTLANTILSATITKTNMLCYGVAAGGASLSVSNGTMPYTYQWSSGQATASITGLPQGYYTVTATDANGCTIAKTALVLSPSLITIAKTTTSASCANNDGVVSVSATGGTGTKTFAWSNGMAGATITGLAAGNYTVTATDANGCERTMTINVASNCNLAIQVIPNNPTCNSVCDGSITITPQIGTAPFSYQWSSNAANTAVQGSATGLCAGVYRATVTDAIGLVKTVLVSLTQPAALTTSITKTNATCVNACDGVATLSVSGGTAPYTYMWSNSSNTTASATGLCQGSYTITATDANGCTAKRSFLIVQSALALSATTTPASCAADGTATLTVSGTGVAPYSYLWSNGTTDAVATGLATGSYTVTATDANGCAKSLHVHIGTSCTMLYDGGISEMSEMTQTPNHLLTAYPNPCGRQVTIGWGQYGAAVRLNVYNSSGQLISVQEHLSGSYEMIVLPDAAGLYWVSVLYADGVQQSIKVVSE